MVSKKGTPKPTKASTLIKKVSAKKSFSNGQKVLSDANALAKLAFANIIYQVDLEDMLDRHPRFGIKSYAERYPDKLIAADAIIYRMSTLSADLPKVKKILDQYNITFVVISDEESLMRDGSMKKMASIEIVAGENDIDENPIIDTLLRLAKDIATKKLLTAEITRQTAELLGHKTK